MLAHEVSLTCVAVGEISWRVRVGDRFMSRPTSSSMVRVCLRLEIRRPLEYTVADQRVLTLTPQLPVPVQPETGYARTALTEPWACVIAAYQLRYAR